MGEREDVVTVTARGAVIAILGNASALVIGAVGVLLLARVLTPADYGQYTIALIPSTFFILFTDWGIDAALPRFLVQSRVIANQEQLRAFVWSGLIVKWVIGMGLAVVLVLFAAPIAGGILNRPDVYPLVQASALVVIGQPLYQTVFAIFAGFERMAYRSTVAVVHATIKAAVSLLLVLLGLGVVGAIGGHVMSALMAAALGVGLLWRVAGPSVRLRNVGSLWAPAVCMIRFGLPLFAGALVLNIGNQVRLILLPWFVSDVVMGNYQVATHFTLLIFSITTALGVTLYPTFSKFSFAREAQSTRSVYRTAVRYSAMLVTPVTLLLVAVAEPMIATLYATRYPTAPGFFVLLALPGLLSGFGHYAFGAWLNSQGDTRSVFIIHVLQAGVAVLLAPVGLVLAGMTGFLLSLLVSTGVATLYAVLHLSRRYQVERVFPHTLRVLAVSGLAAGATYGFLIVSGNLAPVMQLLGGTLLYVTLLLICAPLLGAIEPVDVRMLTTMFGNQRIIGPIIRLILRIETLLLNWLHRDHSGG
jgi:O-antigen/teichoic acid export membrane protein